VLILPDTISPELFRSRITRNGGELLSLDRSSMFHGGREKPRRPAGDRPTDPDRANYN